MIGRMHFPLGDAGASRQWEGYGIAPQRDGREHSATVVLVDGGGRQRIGWPSTSSRPRGWRTTSAGSRGQRVTARASWAASSRSCAAR